MIRPAVPSPPDRYSRLFPPLAETSAQKMNTDRLLALANSLRTPGDQSPIPFTILIRHRPPVAGLTYFGQFIDHDMTCNSTPLRDAGQCAPPYLVNGRTPWLDLDHVYGDGPGSSRHGHLYQSDGASFRLGEPLFKGEAFDVPIGTDDQPAIVDERNGENLIIRQIHAMFLKLHNLAVQKLPSAMPACERFDRARQRVRWLYQWLVRSYFLRELCDPAVYDAIVKDGDRRIDWETDGFSIPVEFAVAGMRFGHSLVRNSYKLNDIREEEGGSGDVTLAALFGANNRGPLDPRFKIDWARFFTSAERAMFIDTSIVEPLFHLPPEDVDLFVNAPPPHSTCALPYRTLLRGAALRLPSGQEVRKGFEIDFGIRETPEEYEADPWRHLEAQELKEESPLWYYILLEAQLDQNGKRLGVVGSRLVAEVIEGSLLMDRESFLRKKPQGWRPEDWESANGETVRVETLLDVARLVGV